MKLSLTLSILLILFAGGCSENETLKKKIEELEKDASYKQKVIDNLHEDIIAKCTSIKEEVKNLGPYTLTETITYDIDWKCAENFRINPSYFEGGVKSAIVRSPTEDLYEASFNLNVEDIDEFYHISGFTGGMHCCEIHYLLSKTTPFKVIFKETVECCDGVQIKNFDDDGYKEVRIEDMNFTYWRGSFASSAFPIIYLEYSTGEFKLDKDLMYSETSKKINNTEPDRLKFYPKENDLSGGLSGWQGHYIPSDLTAITSELMIAGKEQEARKFFEDVWPDNLTDKELYWSIFKEQLFKSKYWKY